MAADGNTTDDDFTYVESESGNWDSFYEAMATQVNVDEDLQDVCLLARAKEYKKRSKYPDRRMKNWCRCVDPSQCILSTDGKVTYKRASRAPGRWRRHMRHRRAREAQEAAARRAREAQEAAARRAREAQEAAARRAREAQEAASVNAPPVARAAGNDTPRNPAREAGSNAQPAQAPAPLESHRTPSSRRRSRSIGTTGGSTGTRSSKRQRIMRGEESPLPEVRTSIRDGAANPHRGNNSQSLLTGSYSIDYRQRSRESSELTTDVQLEAVAANNPASPHAQPQVPLPQPPAQPPAQPPPPPQDPQSNDIRICVCDNFLIPPECPNCQHFGGVRPCPTHETVQCIGIGCNKVFHRTCVAAMQGKRSHLEIEPYTCMECEAEVTSDPTFEHFTGRRGGRNEQNRRFGILSQDSEDYRRDNRGAGELFKALRTDAREEVFNAIKDRSPRPYPTAVHMRKDPIEEHTVCGRRFEIAMLSFQVGMCDCCGRVQPHQTDKFSDRGGAKTAAPVFPRKALTNQLHPAWKCTCSDCNGSQFYAAKKTVHLNKFRDVHGCEPKNFVSLDPNAMICQQCYDYPGRETGQADPRDLDFFRKFSLHNGYGPIQVPPLQTNGERNEIKTWRKGYALMNSLTIAEEAAIRRVAPLMQITKLAGGNIGSKGNTSCVQVHSKVAKFLPNLPEQCKVIVIRRKNQRGGTQLQSTKFSRKNIEEALVFLKATGVEAWKDIEIDTGRLDQWPDTGNLADLEGVTQIEIDEPTSRCDANAVPTAAEGGAAAAEGGREAAAGQGNNDGEDRGPAPLQFRGGPDETFGAVLCLNDAGEGVHRDTTIITQIIRQQVQRVRDATAQNNPGDGNAQPIIGNSVVGGVNVHIDEPAGVATVDDEVVLPVDGFVNMNKDEWAWARAFPTVFIPWFGDIGDHKDAWHITHDFTKWETPHRVRSQTVGFAEWVEYETWRSDGKFASHPIIGLVALNQRMKNQCNAQGRYVLNTSEVEASTLVQEIATAPDDARVKTLVNRIIDKAHIHSSNVQCTQSYWRATYHEFRATSFFHSYINGKETSLFHTGSLAEYHDPFLRELLYKYTMKLSGSAPHECAEILTDDSQFSQAVNKYRQVVSHYLAAKMELWMAMFMKPVFGVQDSNVVFEFAKSRGCIHYHMPCTLENEYMDTISAAMKDCADRVVEIQKDLDWYIVEVHRDNRDRPEFAQFKDLDDILLFNQRGKDARLKYLMALDTEDHYEKWSRYELLIQGALNTCARKLDPIMEGVFGISAMHTGNAPKDFPRPGVSEAAPDLNYRKTHEDMRTSDQVVAAKELKKMKSSREHHLFARRANLTNQCLTHQCSDYCKQTKQHLEYFDAEKHSGADPSDRFTDNDDQERVRVYKKFCRMDFGEFLEYDPSDEKNLTRGKDRVDLPQVAPDKNGIMRYVARRNHPRTVQVPYAALFFGANNDSQLPLINATGPETLKEIVAKRAQEDGITEAEVHKLSPHPYEEYCNMLSAAGLPGLEHYNGSNLLDAYVTGYCTKGNDNPKDWADAQKAITKAYCEREGNEGKCLRNLVAKHMNEIVGNMEFSKDQALYLNGGGVIKRLTKGDRLKASVNPEMDASDLGADAIAEARGEEAPSRNSKKFNWDIAKRYYKKRSDSDVISEMNMYKYLAFHWDPKGKKVYVPQIYGYYNRPTWPPREEFAKYTLCLYRAWRDSEDENKAPDGTFVTTLLEYMWDEEFPGQIRSEMLRAKRCERGVDPESLDLDDGGNALSPADGRTNSQNEQAIAVNPPTAAALPDDGEGFQDMRESMIFGMDRRIPDYYDWSDGFDDKLSTALADYSKAFYESKTKETLENAAAEAAGDAGDTELILFNPEVYVPGKYKTDAQLLIICHHLMCQKRLYEFEHADDLQIPPGDDRRTRPPDQRVLIEGLPGVGKTWLINTMRNVTRQLWKSNRVDMASTPTGCSAALVNGSTHYRLLGIPAGMKLNETPTNTSETKVTQIKEACARLSRIKLWCQDEHSMCGRSMLGWLKARSEEYRQPVSEYLDTDDSDGISDLPAEVSSRPWGGIPFIYILGDSHQLPPVCAKTMYSTEHGTKADGRGKLAMKEFVDPLHEKEEEFSAFMLRDVVRQDDPDFLALLGRLRSGTLEDRDVEWVTKHFLTRLPPERRDAFNAEDVLHLTPTWPKAHKIVYDYIDRIQEPLAIVRAIKSTRNGSGKNCFANDNKLPGVSTLRVGAKVMLTHNYVVEEGLMNGSVGTVKGIYYSTKAGPYERGGPDGKEYVVVEFPDSKIPPEKALIENRPPTWVPVPVESHQCERECCVCRMIPLTVCVALTIHKSQGMTIGSGQMFSKVVVHLPGPRQKSQPGLELVGLSRAKLPDDIAIGNTEADLDLRSIKRMGQGKAYDSRREYETKFTRMSETTKTSTMLDITQCDTSPGPKTYEGGCQSLLKWYNDTLIANGQADSQDEEMSHS